MDCQQVKGLIGKLCKWVKEILKIPFSRFDLVLGTGSMWNEALQAFTHVVRYIFCKHVVWQARNTRVFEQKLVFAELAHICQDMVQTTFCIGAKQQAVEWSEVLTGIINLYDWLYS